MISRQDFTFTIGYEGNIAVVDGALKKRYGSLTSDQLAERQLFKHAICCAVYEQFSGKGTDEALQRVLEIYNRSAVRKLDTVDDLKRTFGVNEVPGGIAKVTVI